MPGENLSQVLYGWRKWRDSICSFLFLFFQKCSCVEIWGCMDRTYSIFISIWNQQLKNRRIPHHGRRFRMSHILESCRKASGSWWRFLSIRCKLLILDGETSNPIFFQFISETTLAPLNHFWHFWLSDPKDHQNCVGNGSGTPLYHAVARGNTSSGCSKYHRDEHFNTEKWWNYQATSRSSGSSGTA